MEIEDIDSQSEKDDNPSGTNVNEQEDDDYDCSIVFQEDIQRTPYEIWKINCQYLYDLLLHTHSTWPSSVCEWGEMFEEHRSYGSAPVSQCLYTVAHTDGIYNPDTRKWQKTAETIIINSVEMTRPRGTQTWFLGKFNEIQRNRNFIVTKQIIHPGHIVTMKLIPKTTWIVSQSDDNRLYFWHSFKHLSRNPRDGSEASVPDIVCITAENQVLTNRRLTIFTHGSLSASSDYVLPSQTTFSPSDPSEPYMTVRSGMIGRNTVMTPAECLYSRTCIVASSRGRLHIWDLPSLSSVSTFPLSSIYDMTDIIPGFVVTCSAFLRGIDSNGYTICVGGQSGDCIIVDIKTRKMIGAHTSEIRCIKDLYVNLTDNPDASEDLSHLMVTADACGIMKIWDQQKIYSDSELSSLHTISMPSPITCVDFCQSNQRYVVVGMESGEIDMLDIEANDDFVILRHMGHITAIADICFDHFETMTVVSISKSVEESGGTIEVWRPHELLFLNTTEKPNPLLDEFVDMLK